MTAAKAPRALEAIEGEVLDPAPDGHIVVRLETELGEADIAVPPINTWRSKARHALFSVGDDYLWARSVLSAEDFKAWGELDPTPDETEAFIERWTELGGASSGESRASRRSSRSTARR